MWNGNYMMWKHISALYHADLEQGLHQLPKITPDHINLTSFSKMKVNLAAQVLSNTVAQALRCFPDGDAEKTAQFSDMVNKSSTASMSDQPQNISESGMTSLHHIQVAMTRVLIG